MDEEDKRQLDLVRRYAESMTKYLDSIRRMLKFFVVLTVVVIVVQVVSLLFR